MFLINAIVIGTFLEVLVYGVYLATFIRHVRVLALRRKKLPPKSFIYLSTASLLLFVLVTVTTVVDLIFVTNILKPTGPSNDYSGYIKKHSVRIICGSFAILISDTVLLYRLYILYNSPNRLRIVALPLLVFIVQCGVQIWNLISLPQQNNIDPWSSDQSLAQNSSFAQNLFGFVSIGLNVMCTSLIVVFMWRSHRRLLAAGVPAYLRLPSAYARVGAIIINSAIINFVWWLSVYVTSNVSSVAFQVLGASYVCVTALIFSAIIVSASRPPSKWESFAPVSFPPEAFPQDSMPPMNLSANDILPDAGVQPAESSSLDKSNDGASPEKTV